MQFILLCYLHKNIYILKSVFMNFILFISNHFRGRMDAAQSLSHPWIQGHPVPRPAILNADGNEDDDAISETEENHTVAISPSSSDKHSCQKDAKSLSLSPCGQSSPITQMKQHVNKERTGSRDGKLMGGSGAGSVDSGDLGEDESDDVEDKVSARKDTASVLIARVEDGCLAKEERPDVKAADSSSYALNGDISEDDSGCVDSVNNTSSACNDDSDAWKHSSFIWTFTLFFFFSPDTSTISDPTSHLCVNATILYFLPTSTYLQLMFTFNVCVYVYIYIYTHILQWFCLSRANYKNCKIFQ